MNLFYTSIFLIRTYTAVRLIKLLLQSRPECKVLVTCQSNTAVDNLLEGLVKLEVKVIRVGAPERAREELHNSTLDAWLERTPQYSQLANLSRCIEDLRSEGNSRVNGEQIRSLQKRLSGLQKEAVAAAFRKAEVVCGTNASIGQSYMQEFSFPVHVMDEATQSTQPSSLISLIKGTKQLFLFGDHKQLAPTVLSDDPELAIPYFIKLLEHGVEPLMLYK